MQFIAGEGEATAELYFPDPSDNPHDKPVLYVFENDRLPLDTVHRVLPNIVAVMSDPRVQLACARAAAGLSAVRMAA